MPGMRLAHLHPLRWLGQRDRGFTALRRAARTAIIMPAMFALGDKVIGNPQLATFAAFGSFAMLLLVDFGGPMTERPQAQAALAVTGGVFVCLATLASQTAWLAAVAMAVAGFGAVAERRSWRERWLGRQPAGVPGTLSAARERITSYLEPHSVWLHNSLRGGAGLGLAVLVARLTGVQHSFWVVLGALSVLRSNALNTGQDAVRAILGTVAGFIAGAALLVGIGTNTTVLWFLLPLAIFLAGVAPAVISFAGGQAAFTLTVVILFSILQPTGWRVGLVRIEDVAIGVSVSLVVSVLFWPRGAAAALRQALA